LDLGPAFAQACQQPADFSKLSAVILEICQYKLCHHIKIKVVKLKCDLSSCLEIQAPVQLLENCERSVNVFKLYLKVSQVDPCCRLGKELESPIVKHYDHFDRAAAQNSRLCVGIKRICR